VTDRRANPVIHAVDTLRALLAGGPAAGPVLFTTAWIIGLVAVFAALAGRRYRRG
jgi:oleandomycin transport system permease protein